MSPSLALTEFALDARFALRQLRKHRSFAAVAIATLALGIGATTAIFTVLSAVVLEPLPFPEAERLVDIDSTWQGEPGAISVGNYFVMKERSRAFALLAARNGATFNLADAGDPERLQGARVTASYFRVFGTKPSLGRVFTEDEDRPGKAPVAVLSHRLFNRRFGADPSIVGRSIHLSGVPYEVIGVMPDNFRIPEDPTEVWTPVAFPGSNRSFDAHYLTVTGRLKEGVSDAQLGADAQALNQAMIEAAPRDNNGRVLRIRRLLDRIVGDYRQRLFVLLGAVCLVFLIACVNVASLLMARGAARQREITVRAALGADRSRIARQLMTEAFVLCVLGTGGGLILAATVLPIFISQSPADVPRLAEARINGPVLLATSVFALLATLLAGLVPAMRASRTGLASGAGQGSRGATGGVRDRVRQAFVAIEVGLTLMLLMGAGLLIRSAGNLEHISPGFDAADILAARLALPIAAYPGEERPAAAVDQIVANLAAQPGVQEAAASTRPPLIGDVNYGLRIEGRDPAPRNRINARMQLVTPGYIETMRMPVRTGRVFARADRRDAPRVIIVNETLARLAWPGADAIGKRIACCEGGDDHPAWKEVVGVVADTKARGLAGDGLPEFYLPMDQAPARSFEANGGSITLVARPRGIQAESLTPLFRGAVRLVDPAVPLYDIATMASRVSTSTAVTRFNRLLLTCLGLAGLALAAIGIYGVISYLAGQRTREIGVRLALGALPAGVLRLIMRQGLSSVFAGIALGAVGAYAQGRAIESLLFGIPGRDAGTLAAASGLLLLVALGAAALPALRASRTDPAKALAEP